MPAPSALSLPCIFINQLLPFKENHQILLLLTTLHFYFNAFQKSWRWEFSSWNLPISRRSRCTALTIVAWRQTSDSLWSRGTWIWPEFTSRNSDFEWRSSKLFLVGGRKFRPKDIVWKGASLHKLSTTHSESGSTWLLTWHTLVLHQLGGVCHQINVK